MDKGRKLLELERQFRAWPNPPLLKNRINPVFGEGNPAADIVFVGEAPGAQENRLGRPFVGAAGKLLDEMMATVGLDRSDVYITNVVKDQPPGNRDPFPAEIEVYLPFLKKQISIIDPKIIVTLGRHSLYNLLPGSGPISQMHGKVFKSGHRYFIALYHPAAALYQGTLKETLFDDFRVIAKLLRQLKEDESTNKKYSQ